MAKRKTQHPLTPLYRERLPWLYFVRCWYCGKKVQRAKSSKQKHDTYTRDHVVPRKDNGRVTVPACFECNAKKKTMPLEQFRAFLLTDRRAEFYGERLEREIREGKRG